MKRTILLTAAFTMSLMVFAARLSDDAIATCTGAKDCKACKNCKYCKHCNKDRGSCGVCS